MKEKSVTGSAYRYFEGVCLDGFLRTSAYVVSREADRISLSWPAESHLSGGYRGLG